MNRLKSIILFSLLLIGVEKSYSQEIDTTKIILNTSEKFRLIHSKEIKGLQVCSYTPKDELEEGDEDIAFGGVNELTFYYADTNIYMIREYNMLDEGGPLTYSASITETYLFNNQPFFYYRKDFYGDSFNEKSGQPVFGLQETRKYIYKGEIIRQLTKYIKKEGMWLSDKSLLLNVQTDSIPNVKKRIEESQKEFQWDNDIKKYMKMIEEANKKE